MRFNLDNYETVEARLAKFWEDCPNGQIFTSIHHYDDNRVVFKAEVYKDISDPRPVATGFAEEVRDASPVNRTSHVENAETSSIGRALANWRYASKTQPRPSRQEMEKVQRMTEQPKPERLTADFVTKFREACAKKGVDPQDVAKQAGVDMNELKDSDAPKLRDAFKSLSTAPAQAQEQAKKQVASFMEQMIQDAFPSSQEVKVEISDPDAQSTKSQVGRIRAQLQGKGCMSYTDKLEKVQDLLNMPDLKKIEHLTKGQASRLIDLIEEMK
jgi:hypothetical protein